MLGLVWISYWISLDVWLNVIWKWWINITYPWSYTVSKCIQRFLQKYSKTCPKVIWQCGKVWISMDKYGFVRIYFVGEIPDSSPHRHFPGGPAWNHAKNHGQKHDGLLFEFLVGPLWHRAGSGHTSTTCTPPTHPSARDTTSHVHLNETACTTHTHCEQ